MAGGERSRSSAVVDSPVLPRWTRRSVHRPDDGPANQHWLWSGPDAPAHALESYEGTRGPRQAPPQQRTTYGCFEESG